MMESKRNILVVFLKAQPSTLLAKLLQSVMLLEANIHRCASHTCHFTSREDL